MPHTNEMAITKGLQKGVKMSDSSNFKTYKKHMQCKHLKTKNTDFIRKCQALARLV